MVTAFEVVVVISFFAIAILPVQIMGATLKSTKDDVIGARRGAETTTLASAVAARKLRTKKICQLSYK